MDANFLYETRPRLDCFIFSWTRRDRDFTWLRISGETETRPRVSVSFSTRPRREPSFNEEKDWILALLFLKTTHTDQDETKTRLNKIEANETRPRRDCLKIFHPRRDRDETTSKILSETGTRPRVSVLLVSRPRRDRDSRQSVMFLIEGVLGSKNLLSKSGSKWPIT